MFPQHRPRILDFQNLALYALSKFCNSEKFYCFFCPKKYVCTRLELNACTLCTVHCSSTKDQCPMAAEMFIFCSLPLVEVFVLTWNYSTVIVWNLVLYLASLGSYVLYMSSGVCSLQFCPPDEARCPRKAVSFNYLTSEWSFLSSKGGSFQFWPPDEARCPRETVLSAGVFGLQKLSVRIFDLQRLSARMLDL